MTPSHEALRALTLPLLRWRQKWYSEGCPDMENGNDYAASGDLARDAAEDLRAALAAHDALLDALDAAERERERLREALTDVKAITRTRMPLTIDDVVLQDRIDKHIDAALQSTPEVRS